MFLRYFLSSLHLRAEFISVQHVSQDFINIIAQYTFNLVTKYNSDSEKEDQDCSLGWSHSSLTSGLPIFCCKSTAFLT